MSHIIPMPVEIGPLHFERQFSNKRDSEDDVVLLKSQSLGHDVSNSSSSEFLSKTETIDANSED